MGSYSWAKTNGNNIPRHLRNELMYYVNDGQTLCLEFKGGKTIKILATSLPITKHLVEMRDRFRPVLEIT